MFQIQGQLRALTQLQRATAAQRLGHTWIFSGPPGVGKFTLAVALAKTMLCDTPQSVPNGEHDPLRLPTLAPDFALRTACGQCESCRAVDNGNHPDLHIITKELIRYHDRGGTSKGTTLSIKVIRGEITGDEAADHQVEAKIYKRSFRGRGKWFIIDDADLMELPAQNALLKTLEEPPPESYLVLITTSPQELLATIRSRSQIVLFNPLPEPVLVARLLAQGAAPDEAPLLARLAQGSLGRALGWLQDIKVIDEKNAAAARKQAGKDEDEIVAKFSPGGILAWVRQLSSALDALIARRNAGTAVAETIAAIAAEFAALALIRDPLTSKDRATRDGIALALGLAADYFSDRLRLTLGTPAAVSLPGSAGALDPATVRALLAAARESEAQVDMNVHVPTLLAALGTRWEQILRGTC